jgi:hypothetical protein
MIAGCTVAWVASEHPQGVAIAKKWIGSRKELVASAGWSALSSIAATVPDENLPLEEFGQLLDRCASTISQAPNRVRYAMNNFVICCGTYILPLADKTITVARGMGAVDVDMGDTACQVPDAESYIIKSRRGAAVAPKRKTTRC